MYPTLMILPDLFQVEGEFRSKGFQIFNVDTVEEARRTIHDLRGITSERPLVLSDLSRLRSQQSILLKFVEETTLPLILLASKDNITSALLSRMKRVVKTSEVVTVERDDPKSLRDLLETEDGEINLGEVVRNCPSLTEFLYLFKRSRLPVKSKLLDLVLSST